jgi:hypothetical protein
VEGSGRFITEGTEGEQRGHGERKREGKAEALRAQRRKEKGKRKKEKGKRKKEKGKRKKPHPQKARVGHPNTTAAGNGTVPCRRFCLWICVCL